eukprot:scaffold13859_cov62-Phaeocystis_antarctica.AAC.2
MTCWNGNITWVNLHGHSQRVGESMGLHAIVLTISLSSACARAARVWVRPLARGCSLAHGWHGRAYGVWQGRSLATAHHVLARVVLHRERVDAPLVPRPGTQDGQLRALDVDRHVVDRPLIRVVLGEQAAHRHAVYGDRGRPAPHFLNLVAVERVADAVVAATGVTQRAREVDRAVVVAHCHVHPRAAAARARDAAKGLGVGLDARTLPA